MEDEWNSYTSGERQRSSNQSYFIKSRTDIEANLSPRLDVFEIVDYLNSGYFRAPFFDQAEAEQHLQFLNQEIVWERENLATQWD